MLREHVINVALEEMPGSAANPDKPKVAKQAKAKVLVVDDDPATRLILFRLLTEEDYFVVTAANGDEALEFSKATKFDLALLDLNRSAKDGRETFEQFSQKNPLLPIILISARPAQLSPTSAAGGCALMEKPLDFTKLFYTIQNLLEKPAELRFSRMTGQPAVFEHIPPPKAQARMSDASI